MGAAAKFDPKAQMMIQQYKSDGKLVGQPRRISRPIGERLSARKEAFNPPKTDAGAKRHQTFYKDVTSDFLPKPKAAKKAEPKAEE